MDDKWGRARPNWDDAGQQPDGDHGEPPGEGQAERPFNEPSNGGLWQQEPIAPYGFWYCGEHGLMVPTGENCPHCHA